MAGERSTGTSRKDGGTARASGQLVTDEPAGIVSGHFSHCQNCGHQPLVTIMDFGHHPPCDSLIRPEQLTGPASAGRTTRRGPHQPVRPPFGLCTGVWRPRLFAPGLLNPTFS